MVCAMSDRCAVLGSTLGFHIHHTTDRVGGASLQMEDAPYACHLIICKGGLVVDVASIAVIIMAIRGFSELAFLVELDKHEGTGSTQRLYTSRGH